MRRADRTRERVFAFLHEVGPDGWKAVPSGSTWTIGQIANHLALVERAIARGLSRVLAARTGGAAGPPGDTQTQAERGGGPAGGAGRAQADLESSASAGEPPGDSPRAQAGRAAGPERTRLPWIARIPVRARLFILRAGLGKPRAPESVVPGPEPDRAQILEMLREERAGTRSVISGASDDDLRAVGWPHGILGSFTGLDWLRFIEAHDARHLARMRTITRAAAPAEPRGPSDTWR